MKAHENELRGTLGVWESGLDDEQRKKLKAEAQAALASLSNQRTDQQNDAVFAAFLDQDEGIRKMRNHLMKLKKDTPALTSTLVMQELPQPRETHVFIKGDFTRPGDVVTPGVPAILPSLSGATADAGAPASGRSTDEKGTDGQSATHRPDRLDLARWIVDPQNPLTSRVLVNRVWQQFFGKGIVETENDFGTQGARPTHPELLDWLACEFMQPGFPDSTHFQHSASSIQHRVSNLRPPAWSLKHLHRLIVASAAYRQSSRVRPDLRDLDPNNKLLARQSRLRLDAEIVRDVSLASSGMLSTRMGGPPVNPPQPDGVMTLGQSKHTWNSSAGEDRYRRGLYTQFYRATPHPALVTFDAPDAFSACTRRIRSNTPLQALTLLNDRQFFELAQSLAARVLREGPPSDADRLDYVFQVCVARKPDAVEKARLNDLLREQLGQTAATGPAKAAEAWTTVARVLLNLDETITRE